MKTIEINLYSFEELSKKVQERVLTVNRGINVDHQWWDSTYEDAENVGLKIDTFDLDRNRHAKGEFIDTPEDVIGKILSNHGKDCETHKTALKYKESLAEINKETNEDHRADAYDNWQHEFLQDILEDYSIILQKECEYLTSEEAIIETIKSNEYTFEENGIMRNM